MFETEDKLKEFILWAKKNKVRHVKVGSVEFTLSNGAIYLPDSNDLNANGVDSSTHTEGESVTEGLPVSSADEEMDDETLFHST